METNVCFSHPSIRGSCFLNRHLVSRMCHVKGKPNFVFHEAYPQGKISLQKAIFSSDWNLDGYNNHPSSCVYGYVVCLSHTCFLPLIAVYICKKFYWSTLSTNRKAPPNTVLETRNSLGLDGRVFFFIIIMIIWFW
jgi:hypothetical protein